ncbi:MAG TPA: ATP-grasp domain-containing protein [Candidatus Udaeobacter sp.]|nr:ATP-grasp domain-containing protein [Candidatus Udaeobacter sp.]
MPISNNLLTILAQHLVFYVCRDLERAIGIDLSLPNYRIITNYNEFSAKLARQYANITLIKAEKQLDTASLLKHKQTQNLIKKNDFVLVFKNNVIIETECKKNGWKLLNPDSKLADKVEGKISQVKWLGSLAKYLPPCQITTCGKIKWNKKTFVLQFNHSHTGSGTFFISSNKQLNDLKAKFFNREARVMPFINGPVFTNNNIVWGNKILIGNISFQITGLSPFTENKFATIGNDWALPHQLLNAKQIKQYKQIATEVGKKLSRDGWKGLYGIDIIIDKKTGRLYLLEINARQPASTTFESQLQKLNTIDDKAKISTFEAHLASLLEVKPNNYQLTSINNGAQIIQKVTTKITKIKLPQINNKSTAQIISYNNDSLESDLFRIQTSAGLMQTVNTFNKFGKEIRSAMLALKK